MKRKGFTYVNTENSFPKFSCWYGKVDCHDDVGCGGGAWYAVTIRRSSVRILTHFLVLTRSVRSWYIHTNTGCCWVLRMCVWSFWPPFVVTEVPYFTFDTFPPARVCQTNQWSTSEAHQRWQGLPSSQVIWLRRQYKHAWFTFLLFIVFFFFPASSAEGSMVWDVFCVGSA